MEFTSLSPYATITERRIEGPSGLSDGEIWERSIGPIYHLEGLIRWKRRVMIWRLWINGFKMRGMKGLRVVDHAVAPLITNHHTQSTYYSIVSHKTQA